MRQPLIVASDRFADHVTPPGHPERVERADVFSGVALRWRDRGGRVVEPEPASAAAIGRVHAAAYVDAMAATAGHSVRLDPDTYTSPDTYEVARLAAGAAVTAVEHALGESGPVVAMVRPPGHHAEADRAMGFCLFNNVAIAAAHARAAGVGRVAIVDFDVHHGNGTQAMFYADPSVLYVSLHQHPYYPGSGAAGEIGQGAGTGFTVNVPLEAGATDADYDLAFAELVVPVLDAFEPGLVIVSAGYDAHHRDPLASMRVSSDGFTAMMARLWLLAAGRCAGRLAVVTEGGYDLPALESGIETTIAVLASAPAPPEAMQGDHARARASIDAVRSLLRPHWPTL
jgi:acetoin utilization deacetylase AcuC-like enzyme